MKKSKMQKNGIEELHKITFGKINPVDLTFEPVLKHGTSKKKKAFKIVAKVLAFGTITFVLYNYIIDRVYNSNPPARDPFTSDSIWDNNDNDLQFDDDGNLIADPMTDADKQVVASQIGQLLVQDATSRGQNGLGEIQEIMSICLLPYNLREENNQDNKYFLSILFRDEKASYALNYFAGNDFSSKEESLKNYFVDFVNFLNFDCALANCSKMEGAALTAKYALGEQVLHVGKEYAGYTENGDRDYFIPVYNQDGTTTLYSTWSSPLDAYDLNPMEEFLKEVSGQTSETLFRATTIAPSQSLQKVMQILDQCKTKQSSDQPSKENE